MRFNITVVAVLFGAMLGASRADAMPVFARKYGVACTFCHTTIPRLNAIGYKFRAAGFRLADSIGKAEPEKNHDDERVQLPGSHNLSVDRLVGEILRVAL